MVPPGSGTRREPKPKPAKAASAPCLARYGWAGERVSKLKAQGAKGQSKTGEGRQHGGKGWLEDSTARGVGWLRSRFQSGERAGWRVRAVGFGRTPRARRTNSQASNEWQLRRKDTREVGQGEREGDGWRRQRAKAQWDSSSSSSTPPQHRCSSHRCWDSCCPCVLCRGSQVTSHRVCARLSQKASIVASAASWVAGLAASYCASWPELGRAAHPIRITHPRTSYRPTPGNTTQILFTNHPANHLTPPLPWPGAPPILPAPTYASSRLLFPTTLIPADGLRHAHSRPTHDDDNDEATQHPRRHPIQAVGLGV